MSDKKQDAIMSMLSPLRSNDRLLMATSAYAKWKQYQAMFHAVEEQCKQEPKLASKLAPHAAAMLFEGEAHLRAFLKEALVSVNALRDSGMMETVLRGEITRFATNDGMSKFEEALTNAEEKIRASNKDLSVSFLTEARSILKKHVRTIQSSKGQLHISAVLGKEERLLVVEPTPRPGHFGRIDPEQFFDSTIAGTNVVASRSMLAVDHCHSLRAAPTGKDIASSPVVDVYGSIIASMAWTRETVYWIARRTGEVGLGAFEGRDPLTIAGAIIGFGIACAVAGAVVLIVGIALGDEALIGAGLFLLLLGGAMIIGGAYMASVVTPAAVACPPCTSLVTGAAAAGAAAGAAAAAEPNDLDLAEIPGKPTPRRPRKPRR